MIASSSQCRPNDACSQPRDKKWECAMGTPRHHRDEAQTCLELAQLMIDPHAARIFRAAAAQHIVQARELEAIETARLTPGGEPTSPPTSATKAAEGPNTILPTAHSDLTARSGAPPASASTSPKVKQTAATGPLAAQFGVVPSTVRKVSPL
jgi:hypothetical protein